MQNRLQHNCDKQKRAKVVSDNLSSYVAKELNVDYLTRNAERLLGFRPMKIRYGNGATVVVRARESLVHGEGWQLTFLIQING